MVRQAEKSISGSLTKISSSGSTMPARTANGVRSDGARLLPTGADRAHGRAGGRQSLPWAPRGAGRSRGPLNEITSARPLDEHCRSPQPFRSNQGQAGVAAGVEAGAALTNTYYFKTLRSDLDPSTAHQSNQPLTFSFPTPASSVWQLVWQMRGDSAVDPDGRTYPRLADCQALRFRIR